MKLQINVGFFFLLGLLFVGLKLGGLIAWSWWLVLLPFYLVPAIAFVSVGFVMLLWFVVWIFDR